MAVPGDSQIAGKIETARLNVFDKDKSITKREELIVQLRRLTLCMILGYILTCGCASSQREKVEIQPPPRNDIAITQDDKKVGTLTGTAVVKGQTFYIFNLAEPFCLQYIPQATNLLQLPPELSRFRDSYTLIKRDSSTYCATGTVVFQLMAETKQLVPLLSQKKINKVMNSK